MYSIKEIKCIKERTIKHEMLDYHKSIYKIEVVNSYVRVCVCADLHELDCIYIRFGFVWVSNRLFIYPVA